MKSHALKSPASSHERQRTKGRKTRTVLSTSTPASSHCFSTHIFLVPTARLGVGQYGYSAMISFKGVTVSWLGAMFDQYPLISRHAVYVFCRPDMMQTWIHDHHIVVSRATHEAYGRKDTKHQCIEECMQAAVRETYIKGLNYMTIRSFMQPNLLYGPQRLMYCHV